VENDLDAIKSKVMPFLSQYLEDMEVEIVTRGNDQWISCLNPEHEDSDPSMHFVPESDSTILKCFSCNASYNIFHAANILEDKPLSGKEFIQDNLYYLCDKYNIKHDLISISEDELREISIRKAYRDAAKVFRNQCIKDKDFSFVNSRNRGISDTIAASMGIGTVYWDPFKEEMKELGHNQKWLESIGISSDFIGLDYLTFILKDEKGDCIGLARRWMRWKKEDHKASRESGSHYIPKYKNSDSTKNPLYKKNQFLYGLYRALEAKTSKIDLVEGYTDAIAMMQAGHSHVAAVCGTAITKDQVQLLKDLGFTNINITLDGDEAGIHNMDKYLESFRSTPGIRVTITILEFDDSVEPEDRDPCYWIQMHGLAEYFEIKRKTAFDWQLEKLISKKVAYPDIAKQMIDYILAESSAIDRESLTKELSSRTGISRDAIQKEINSRTNNSVNQIIDECNKRISRAQTAEQKLEFLRAAVSKAETSVRPKGVEDLSVRASYSTIENITNKFVQDNPGLTGWDCGIEGINKYFGGIPKSKELIAFGGNPNTGKSTLLYNICYGLLNNEPNGLTCAFWSLDDPIESVTAKMLAIKTGFSINQCKYASNNIPARGISTRDTPEYKEAIEWIHNVTRSGKFIPQSTGMGETIESCEKWLRSIREETGNDIVLFIDSFHNISGGGDDERIKAKRAAEWMQKISDTLDLTIVCTMECNKQGMNSKRPHIEHLGESGKMAFSFKLVGMVYNDLHENRERAKSYWTDSNGKDRPIIEVSYEKNKITSYKGTQSFKFKDECATLEEISYAQIEEMVKNRHEKKIEKQTGIPNVKLYEGNLDGFSSTG